MKHPYVNSHDVWLYPGYTLHPNGTLALGHVINGAWWLRHDGEGTWEAHENRNSNSYVTAGRLDPDLFKVVDKGFSYRRPEEEVENET